MTSTHKMTSNLAESCVRKTLRTRNCRRRFIKNLLPEKRNENMETKQPRFKSRLNKGLFLLMSYLVLDYLLSRFCQLF